MSDALIEAQKLYQDGLDAQREQRVQIEEDLAFSDPSDPQQWDEKVRLQRENDPGGKRPCLVNDQTGQYVANVAGQVEKQPPAIHAIPVAGGADKKAAEQIDGRFRHIEHASKASQHYARALTSAARTGVGYLVVRPVYVDRALGWQEPRIGSEPDPLKVVFDSWSVETDGSDADWGFIMSSMSISSFKQRWKNKEAVDFGALDSQRYDTDRKSVLVAEQWFKEQTTRNMIVYVGADGQEASDTEDDYWAACKEAGYQLEYLRNYSDKTQVVKWRRMSGADILEESEYQADAIGIVPVYGYVGFADGRMKYCGIPRRARSAQQAYNYHKSELMMPGAQLLASQRAVAGLEDLWDKAHVERRAFLPFNDADDLGQISAPTLVKVGSSLVDHASGAESALRDIQASIGMYQANLGAASNETSGVAIESRKQQGEASTAHFPAHMAASLGHVGSIVMQMDARLSDTRRSQPIIGVDGSAGRVTYDPDQKESFNRTPDGVTINPSVGKYSVRVVVGASYSTQRTQTNAAFGEIMRGNPELAPTVAPFWAQTLDFPGSDKFAQAMAAMAPAPVKAILQPEGHEDAPDPAALAQQVKQLQEALQEAVQLANEAQQDADEAEQRANEAERTAKVKEEALEIDWFKAETDRLKVTGANVDQIEAVVGDLINKMLTSEQPLGDEQPMPQDPEAWQGGLPMEQPELMQFPDIAEPQMEQAIEPTEPNEGMM